MPTTLQRVIARMRRAPVCRPVPTSCKAKADTFTAFRPGHEYWFHKPHPRQAFALSLDAEELFFGGAAGGGKSDWILMEALKYVHVPGYAALILRKNYTLLSKAGAIMDRARQWLHGTDAKWNAQLKRFTFPSGAILEFGFIEHPSDWMNFQSTEYQFIGWDELTEFALAIGAENNPFLCLRRSLRANKSVNIPLRIRAASNPGNTGHAFVKDRFITDGDTDNASDVVRKEGRVYVKSYLRDNFAMNADEYEKNLAHLPPVTRARLLGGDWDASENLQIPGEWIRHFRATDGLLHQLTTTAGLVWNVAESRCKRFATIDTAGTSREKAEERKGKPPSWSVVGIWDYDRSHDTLFLRHVYRERVSWGELKAAVPNVLRQWNCKRAKIENAHLGQALAEELRGFEIELVGPSLPGMSDGWRGAKLERAICSGFLSRLEAGKILIPERTAARWVDQYVAELIAWGGTSDEQVDQIDVSGYASHEASKHESAWGGVIK